MADCAVAHTSTQSQPALLARSAGIAVIPQGHRLRKEAEALIERVYIETFGVDIQSHFPVLIGVVDECGRIIAAAGCRCAADEPLFLEQYLDEPIERALARAAGADVTRARIGEIGSLATAGGGAPLLFAALACYLSEQGMTHAVATATRRLRRAFTAFGFSAGEIGVAQKAKLPNAGRDWGRYFEHDPVVVWGRVAAGLRRADMGLSL
jgi:hypothetical protein